MHSSVRTYDPTEANMFYVPAFIYEWTGEAGGLGSAAWQVHGGLPLASSTTRS